MKKFLMAVVVFAAILALSREVRAQDGEIPEADDSVEQSVFGFDILIAGGYLYRELPDLNLPDDMMDDGTLTFGLRGTAKGIFINGVLGPHLELGSGFQSIENDGVVYTVRVATGLIWELGKRWELTTDFLSQLGTESNKGGLVVYYSGRMSLIAPIYGPIGFYWELIGGEQKTAVTVERVGGVVDQYNVESGFFQTQLGGVYRF